MIDEINRKKCNIFLSLRGPLRLLFEWIRFGNVKKQHLLESNDIRKQPIFDTLNIILFLHDRNKYLMATSHNNFWLYIRDSENKKERREWA